MRLPGTLPLAFLCLSPVLLAQTKSAPPQTVPNPPRETPAAVAKYVKVPAAAYLLLQDVRVIDGTGAPAREHQDMLLHGGKIQAIRPHDNDVSELPPGVVVLGLAGRTVFPGLVGMHDHMYYIARPDLDAEGHSEAPLVVPQMTFTSPHLYLGAGVTTMRTTGSVEPYTDLNLKQQIEAGELAGPHMDVTAPYLEGPHSPFIQMHQLKDEADARRTVDFWADQGATSFKAYMNITRAELGAAIDEAHKRGLKLTGHLCSVTYPEAVALGIDDLEHGFFVNTQMDPGKQPDLCPRTVGNPTLAAMKAGSPEAVALIKLLVDHHVALTSTLPVFESSDPRHLHLQSRVLDTMTETTRNDYLMTRNGELTRPAPPAGGIDRAANFRNGMALEREFVAAGGLLLAGPDPTGDGGVLPGYGDQREVELLVDAGFTPVEAIRIATLNGATYLGRADRIGTIMEGKNADLVVVRGDPSMKISDIENTEIVFKDGVGYDSQKLLDSAKGRYGQY
ncbi:MAG: amidohydrolase family protein [Janthinobacterium lividum]